VAVAKLEAISKRKLPVLATIEVTIVDDGMGLLLEAPGMEPLWLPASSESYTSEASARVECSGRSTTQGDAGWWLGTIDAWHHARGSAWVSSYLNRHVGEGRLLSGKKRTNYALMRSKQGLAMESYPPAFPLIAKANVERCTDYAARFKENQKRFADFAPLLLVNRASAAFVGARGGARTGEESYPIDSFRGNIVVQTERAWIEETWKCIDVGGVTLNKIKECPRCTVPCRDEMTGDFVFPNEKLLLWKLLRTAFPRKNSDSEWGTWAGPFFGVYYGHAGQQGTLRVGDPIRVVKTAPWDAHLRCGTAYRALLLASAFAMFAILIGLIITHRAN